MKCFLALAVLIFAQAASLWAADSLALVAKGKSDFVIVLADDALPAEKTAASELKKFLEQITGATFAIQSEKETPAEARQIVVGPGARAKALLPQFDWSQVGSDGIVLKSGPSWIVLAGDRPRGTLYAVYEFLEQVGGVRFWYADATLVPSHPDLAVPALDEVYTPQFAYREHYNHVSVGLCDPAPGWDAVYTARLRENGNFNRQTEEWGGHYKIIGWCHTLPELIPSAKYFQEHPEWFPDADNKMLPCTAKSKMPGNVQLVLTAPGLVDEVAKNALELIRKDPSAGYISISESDGGPYAKDPKSEEFLKREGSQSGIFLDFVNQVAEKIHQEYPDFIVEFLAYTGTEKPPKTIVSGKNVIVRLAPLGSDYGHPLDSDWNKDVRANLEDWAKVAPKLFVWNYMVNFYHCWMFHPNWNNLGSDLRFFAAHHVTGVFEQGNEYTGGVGDFVELRTYVVAKLLWNPDLDQSALMDEFLAGYYGPVAGPLLRQYIDIQQKSFDDQKRKLSTYNYDFTFQTITVMNEATQLIDQAAAAVKDDPAVTARIARLRMSLDMGWLLSYNRLQKEAKAKGVEFLGPPDLQKGVDDLEARAKVYKIVKGGEVVNLDKRLAEIREQKNGP
jgi:hypothetical protein